MAQVIREFIEIISVRVPYILPQVRLIEWKGGWIEQQASFQMRVMNARTGRGEHDSTKAGSVVAPSVRRSAA